MYVCVTNATCSHIVVVRVCSSLALFLFTKRISMMKKINWWILITAAASVEKAKNGEHGIQYALNSLTLVRRSTTREKNEGKKSVNKCRKRLRCLRMCICNFLELSSVFPQQSEYCPFFMYTCILSSTFMSTNCNLYLYELRRERRKTPELHFFPQ